MHIQTTNRPLCLLVKCLCSLPIVFAICCLLFTSDLAYSSGIHYSDDVVMINDDTFKSIIAENEAVVVKFFAPWCRHCQSLSHKYSEVASKLKAKSSPVICCALDASKYTEIGEHENIQYYPTFRLYKNEKFFEFKGNPDVEGILNWINLKMSYAVPEIRTKEDLDALRKDKRVVFVSFIKDNSSLAYKSVYEQAERYEGEPSFVSILTDNLKNLLSVKDNVQMMVYKKFDELEEVMEGEATYDTVKTFVKSNIVPLLSNFNAEDAKLMFDIRVNVLLFVGNSTNPLNTSKKDIIDKYRNVMLETAKSFRGTVAFAHVDSDLEDHSRILEFFDLTAVELPAIRLIKIKGDLIKYKYDNENEISAINLTHFVQNCIDNKIEPHYRSQKLPDDWNNGPVKTLVQSNIISVSHDPSKAVLVEFFAPWCGICQRLEPVYNLLGTHFENHSDVFVAKIDATLNEIPSIPIRSFPTIMLFPKGENIQPIVYGGNRTLESLIMFIKTEGISESAIVDKDKSIPTDEKESVAVPAKEEL